MSKKMLVLMLIVCAGSNSYAQSCKKITNLFIRKLLTVCGNTLIKGDLTVQGSQTIDGNSTVDGNAAIHGSVNYGSTTSLNATLYPVGTPMSPGLKIAYALINAGSSPSIATNYVNANISITRIAAGKYTVDYSAAGFAPTLQPIILTTVAQFSISGSVGNVGVITNSISSTSCTVWTMLNGVPSDDDGSGATINFSFLAIGAS